MTVVTWPEGGRVTRREELYDHVLGLIWHGVLSWSRQRDVWFVLS